jgi:hypothetical protein
LIACLCLMSKPRPGGRHELSAAVHVYRTCQTRAALGSLPANCSGGSAPGITDRPPAVLRAEGRGHSKVHRLQSAKSSHILEHTRIELQRLLLNIGCMAVQAPKLKHSAHKRQPTGELQAVLELQRAQRPLHQTIVPAHDAGPKPHRADAVPRAATQQEQPPIAQGRRGMAHAVRGHRPRRSPARPQPRSRAAVTGGSSSGCAAASQVASASSLAPAALGKEGCWSAPRSPPISANKLHC